MSSIGKANSLIKLKEKGFRVPSFFVAKINDKKEDILVMVNKVLSGVRYFAVRSSAGSEDSKEKSYAGHFYSALGVTKENLYDEFIKVVDSYCGKDGVVIIQEFIPSDKAGVIFSQVDNDKMIIDSTFGLCRPVVSGYKCDEYVLNKKGEIAKKYIAREKEIEIFKDGKIETINSSAESLILEEVNQLFGAAKNIQSFLGYPQDIEWCIKDGILYILQSRPITRDFKLEEEEYFFDSANIAESYSGVVLPLTFSYAQYVYKEAYMDLLIMSGVSKSKIRKYQDIFSNLLGHFYGRMYYNMNNWYKMTAFIPGYQRNKKNLEGMMTSNVREEVNIPVGPSLWLKIFYPFIAGTKILLFSFTAVYFKLSVQAKIKKIQKYDFNDLNYEKCSLLFKDLSDSLLHKWYITLENDFLVMTYLGLLEKMVNKDDLQRIIAFQSMATKQIDAIANLSLKMQENKVLWDSIEEEDVEKFECIISKNIEIEKILNDYLMEFGYRFANELKLESIGIEEDVTKLFEVLKVYKNYKALNHEVEKVTLSLPLLKRILFFFVLGEFKKYASQREKFRLLRSSAFGIIRRLFRRMGNLLYCDKTIENEDDIFYLTMQEVFSDDLSMRENFKLLIETRKKEYLTYENMNIPIHFSTKKEDILEFLFNEEELKDNYLSGKPSFPGIVRGKVRVFKDFSVPKEVDFDILVASHTDPGWTPIIALAKGLIIEHGGLLSHASIVARELNIPTIIGALNATDRLKDGQIVEMDGRTGIIKIIQ
ncbi:MAG: PEP/pyruvate-binding domain-containing protein [Candidatus Paceibacterota bacterium]|jgi:pyruvate,water dikinase